MTEPAGDGPAPGGAPLRSLTASLFEALRTRLDLATVELEIQALLVFRMLAWMVAALACVLLALALGVTALIVALWNTHRMLGLLGGSGVFVLLAILLAWLGLRTVRGRPAPLSGSLGQLGEDQREIRGRP
ncbi:MAG: phage holin family protein [Proteobacteria bacterium]|nr:phage holin family protein [Pseudomonadota bacterium]